MAELVRAITADGSAMAVAIDATDLVFTMAQMHQTCAVATVALGRLATAAALMGGMLSGAEHTVTLRVDGKGPLGHLVAVVNARGDVKAYLERPNIVHPFGEQGKLDIAGAVGRAGTLCVMKDVGADTPSIGQVALVSGEIAEDITSYYATSEQIPTVCGLGVEVEPNLQVKSAGGFLVQLLPFADEACIEQLEENIKKIDTIGAMLVENITPEEICNRLLAGLQPHLLDRGTAQYRCDCSKQRVERALYSLSKAERCEMAAGEQDIEISCHFCNKTYLFAPTQLSNTH